MCGLPSWSLSNPSDTLGYGHQHPKARAGKVEKQARSEVMLDTGPGCDAVTTKSADNVTGVQERVSLESHPI